MDTEMRALSASELAALVGVTKAEVDRLVGLGILVARDGAGPFLETDVQKVRLATACEQAGLPLDVLAGALESMGFARMAPDELIRQDELEVVPLLQLGLSRGILDQVWLTRLGRAYADGLRLAANAENEAYRARFTGPVRASGADQRTTLELASQLATEFLPLVDPALLGIYRRQQEVVWTQDLVEDIENELEAAGVLGRPGRVPAMSFLDLVGYTRLTEERGDQAAAELAGTLAVLVDRSSREHGGVPVKWLGDGVMVHYRDPAGAVRSALHLVEE